MIEDYDLWKEPWIHVLFCDGDRRFVGFGEALTEAHRIREVLEPALTLRFGLYRVLGALVASLFRFEELDELEASLADESFDPRTIARYGEENQRRFRLFDNRYPFMQTAAEPALASKRKPIAELVQHLPSGTFATHFRHGLAGDERWSPAVCARALAAVPPFMTAGGAGYSPSINGAPPWYVWICGENLKQSLLLNTVAEVDELGEPAWRQGTPIRPKEERKRYSLLEGLTWQPRIIQLIPGPPGRCTYTGELVDTTVSEMIFTYGLKVGDPEGWTDPAVPYRYEEKGRVSLKPREGKQAWRDFSAFMLANERSEKVRRPQIIRQLKELLRNTGHPAPEAVECFGIRTDNMKIFEWRHETLEIPPSLFRLRNPEQARAIIEDIIKIAEEHARLLRHATKKAYPREGSGNRAAFDRLIECSATRYWDLLERKFWEFLHRIAEHEPSQEADAELRAKWRKDVRSIGQQILEFSLDQLGRSGDTLRRAAAARRYYHGTLKKLAG